MTAREDPVAERLLQAVHARFGVAARLDDPLTSLGVDSLLLAEFVSELERAFEFEADQDIFDVETLAELADYIRARRAS